MEQQHDTITIAIEAVKKSGLLGVTSTEISKSTGLANNRITAALFRAHSFGCLRREKVFGASARYRYFYLRDATREDYERESKGEILPPSAFVSNGLKVPPRPVTNASGVDVSTLGRTVLAAERAERAVLISLNIGDRTPVYVSVKEARVVYNQLREVFGG